MGKNEEKNITDINTELTGKEKRKKNLRPPWKKGDPTPNPKGRTVGTKNFATLYKEALIKLAKMNDKDPAELELEIISRGLKEARSGPYPFYKDLQDRLHGKAPESFNIQHEGSVSIGVVILPKKE